MAELSIRPVDTRYEDIYLSTRSDNWMGKLDLYEFRPNGMLHETNYFPGIMKRKIGPIICYIHRFLAFLKHLLKLKLLLKFFAKS